MPKITRRRDILVIFVLRLDIRSSAISTNDFYSKLTFSRLCLGFFLRSLICSTMVWEFRKTGPLDRITLLIITPVRNRLDGRVKLFRRPLF